MYKTIYAPATGELTEKKSKFIANSAPVSSKEEAEGYLQTIRKKYYDATHNVFAYRITENILIERQSDDGEPAGAGGKPLLELLRGEELVNIIIVVTRYYGGTLLGTGGLVRAYGRCGKLALKDIIEKREYVLYSLKSNYETYGKIEHYLRNNDYILHDTLYTDSVEFMVYVDTFNNKNFLKDTEELTYGKVKPEALKKVYGFRHDGMWHFGDTSLTLA